MSTATTKHFEGMSGTYTKFATQLQTNHTIEEVAFIGQVVDGLYYPHGSDYSYPAGVDSGDQDSGLMVIPWEGTGASQSVNVGIGGSSKTMDTNAAWISVGYSGGTTGTVEVEENAGGCPRSALVWVKSLTTRTNGDILPQAAIVQIYQHGRPGVTCKLDGITSLTPDAQTAAVTGGDYSVDVELPDDRQTCIYYTAGIPSWITGIETSYTGDQSVGYTVAPQSDGIERKADVYFGSHFITVTQPGATYTLSAAGAAHCFGAVTGATFNLTVDSPEATWSAEVVGASWATVTSITAGVGNQAFTYDAEANLTGADRFGTITVYKGGGGTIDYSITQYGISVDGFVSFGSAAQVGCTAGVYTHEGCTWTATTSDSWIHLTTSTGSGDGSVVFDLDENTTGDWRYGLITVEGMETYVEQEP